MRNISQARQIRWILVTGLLLCSMILGLIFNFFHFQWDWGSFWTELAAGLITFAAGIPLAFRLIRHELLLQDTRSFNDFQRLAYEITDDFSKLDQFLNDWLNQIQAMEIVGPIDPMPLTWDVDSSIVRQSFTIRGLHRTTQIAINWYYHALQAAKEWNTAIREGRENQDLASSTMLRLVGAQGKIRDAIRQIEDVAKLRS